MSPSLSSDDVSLDGEGAGARSDRRCSACGVGGQAGLDQGTRQSRGTPSRTGSESLIQRSCPPDRRPIIPMTGSGAGEVITPHAFKPADGLGCGGDRRDSAVLRHGSGGAGR